MPLPGNRRSKRKASEDEEEGATADEAKTAETGEAPKEAAEEEKQPSIIKKPRKDLAAAAKAAAADEDKEKADAATAAAAKSPPRKAKAAAPAVTAKSPPAASTPEDEPDDGAEIPEEPAESWNQKLVTLLLYKHQFKSLNVSASNNSSLRDWVDVQRKLYRRYKKDSKSVTSLQQEQLTVLEAIDFPFTLKGALHWDRFFEKLKLYKAKHDHVLVPRLCEFPGLGDWVVDQRRQYKMMMQGKSSGLDTERIKKLEEVGMVWHVRNRPEWNSRFDELLEYKKKYNDTKVPQHYKGIPGLGKWVAKQREQYRLMNQGKHSFLTADRLEKLQDVGFVFSVRSTVKEEEGAVAGADSDKKEEVATPATTVPKKEDTTTDSVSKSAQV